MPPLPKGTLIDSAPSVIASGNINPRRFCVFTSTGAVAQNAAAGAACHGVALFGALDGQPFALFRGEGTRLQIESGGAFNPGDKLMSDASGRAVVATGTNAVCATAMQSSSGAGQFPEILLGVPV